MHDHLENQVPESTQAPASVPGAAAENVADVGPAFPGVVHRDGVAYVEGTDIPIWRLEMCRRSGSKPPSLLQLVPGLTPRGLEVAYAYAAEHPHELDDPIRELGLDDFSPEDEEDDAAEFQTDLDELFERDAELFRRLAQ